MHKGSVQTRRPSESQESSRRQRFDVSFNTMSIHVSLYPFALGKSQEQRKHLQYKLLHTIKSTLKFILKNVGVTGILEIKYNVRVKKSKVSQPAAGVGEGQFFCFLFFTISMEPLAVYVSSEAI